MNLPSEPGRAAGGPKILVVDDDRDNADSLALLITSLGYEARVAYDGPAAVALARTFRPAVALVDLAMPGMDGTAVARQLCGPGAPRLVAVTGHADQPARDAALAAGFELFVVKPADPVMLQGLLVTLVGTPPR